ncbi:TPA: DUF4435 domain-containing protein [Klebsiella pneumoniae]|uniref:DUF4435 domain-containing protein n=1 Tax=Klebsiella pneumoniae TaxID=573 RepID=UPI000E2CFD6B|nr:DUF4435 domain-containing protein [Klebsiella pneumoniae]MCM8063513.1 DUF4435 domain-containing protein [Enterobacter hormaechei]HDU4109400.1 DUF4435 domain-containing protein [Klebsiella aerogenes]MCM8119449.1 DUF4435 domain-containing protein [Enterobacter hormaechei]SXG43574.1 Uncharacterised protein [Klebsiella pneumoniae]HCT4905027.1 DUF4435 domain-containing protein [Klebsiella pneumoniae]
MSERIGGLRKKREADAVMQLRFNKFLSKAGNEIILAVEGDDDVTFYTTVLQRVYSKCAIGFVCNGKDGVLQLRNIVRGKKTYSSVNLTFYVDHDFDGLKGDTPSYDLYCTPTYSFENILVDIRVLNTLLSSEYRCNGFDGLNDIESIGNIYYKRLDEFNTCMKLANNIIHHLRTNGIQSANIDNDIKKYVRISLDGVQSNCEYNDLLTLIGVRDEEELSTFNAGEEVFEKLNPVKSWRGKYILSFFIKILSDLKEDRGRKTPVYFSSKKKMTFNPSNDVIRTLTSCAPIPDCLVAFMNKI